MSMPLKRTQKWILLSFFSLLILSLFSLHLLCIFLFMNQNKTFAKALFALGGWRNLSQFLQRNFYRDVGQGSFANVPFLFLFCFIYLVFFFYSMLLLYYKVGARKLVWCAFSVHKQMLCRSLIIIFLDLG